MKLRGGARIGVDIGGTFTDLVLSDAGGRTWFDKRSSTPAQPEQAVLDGIVALLRRAGLEPADLLEVLHGTTVGSNTLLQQSGARTGLITTKGFRDVLEIGRVRTPDMFDLQWDKPVPLVPRRLRAEVAGRIAADGSVIEPLDEDGLRTAAADLVAQDVQSIAICFINSYRNPAHERRADAVLREYFPDLAITASVSVLAEMREYERTSTAVVNAYVLPILQSYLQRLRDGLLAIGITAPLLVSDSNGGLAAARTAMEKPVFFISSGRSAGVVGAARLGRAAAEMDVVVFDMGGTTASASLVQGGQISRANEYEFRAGISVPARFIKAGGYMMRVPTVDVAEVGSGGGSIAWIDDGGLLHVGPVSAGADPGPACYGQGGERPTVSDANVVLGYLPDQLAGGGLHLDVDKARAVIQRDLAAPLGLSVEEAAFGVREVANANMARAIRAVSVERGIDPRDFTLAAFGGSGPVHACDLAKSLDINRVLLPMMPGVFTALGMLTGDVERHFLTAMPGLLQNLRLSELDRAVADLRLQAAAALRDEHFTPEQMVLAFSLELRFEGQDSELPVRLPDAVLEIEIPWLRQQFLAAYEAVYQYAADDAVEVVNLRLLARGVRAGKLDFATLSITGVAEDHAPASEREVYFGRDLGWSRTRVLDRQAFTGTAHGPLILQSSDSTVVVPPGGQVANDGLGNLLIDLREGTGQ
ncbi:MAG: hydantoinase/oxoprolinase family protein [Rhodospirillaceae bacterium]|jgi:N-methylhydantoinase A|nr:hydantoinase/oxoprolinase family protein [Rhodospirillaceae bacterium]MBT3491633.1 hydantoinase/oxoprolinase family protein [Rhodospirillaceae bacterium]MBT3781035.1 hydantoinase/oxoprolinase family protein [Rhodospirillaceae bacterium]MBT3976171.1 hydantoinase/oxoprolinase family protein [Rhodospirillaceae bacterium]MBT4168915.1 hydantoinase/oxoprolinase family protein [Rhodospirillaceae bacterium]